MKIVISTLETDGEVNDSAKNNNIWCRARMFNFMCLQITEHGAFVKEHKSYQEHQWV